MRILWASNFTTQSGYSNQAQMLVDGLVQAGHRVDVLELGGGGGVPHRVPLAHGGSVQIIPPTLDPLGSDLVIDHARQLRSDAVLSLVDAWGLRPEVWGQLPWYPIAPIDHTPVPPAVLRSLQACRQPVAISKFGFDEMRKAGLNPFYLPHAVDPTVFHPMDQRTARQQVSAEMDAFWVSFVGVNDSVPSRKGIFELLAAWSIFSAAHRDARLYMHTAEQGNLPVNNVGGVRIDELMRQMDIDPRTVKLVQQYEYRTGIPQSFLAQMASASDVFVLPSRGEGFGLPLIEFQRCGCPVITTDFAAGAELCASGWRVEFEPAWTWQNAVNANPSIASIVENLEKAYAARGDMRYRLQAIEFARNYDVDVVIQRYALPLIRAIAERELDLVKVV